MKINKIIIYILTFSISISVYSQSNDFSVVDKLIQERKYSSAFNELNEMNKDGSNLEVLVKQIRFITQYCILSIQLERFFFKDLEPNEDIEQMRINSHIGDYNEIAFDPINIYKKYNENNVKSDLLDFAYAEFIEDAINRYGEQWNLRTYQAEEIIKTLYKSSYESGIYNDKSLAKLGDLASLENKTEEAKTFYLRSIELNAENAHSHYSVAILFINDNDIDNFYTHIDNAIKYYRDSNNKNKSYITASQVSLNINKDTNLAIEYLNKGKKDFPRVYSYPQDLIRLYLDIIQYTKAGTEADYLFSIAPRSQTTIRQIYYIYKTYSLDVEFINFYERNLEKYKEDEYVLGNLNYTLGLIYKENNNNPEAVKYLNLAVLNYTNIFGDEADIISLITNIKKDIE